MNKNYLIKLKDCFKKCDYIPNKIVTLKNGEKTYTLLMLADELDIEVPARLVGWIKQNLTGFWGNKKIKCTGNSDKIFEILNLIMEKLK